MKTTLHTAYHGILILRDGNHNYAYGGLIGDLCTGQEEQEFKFGDKKLDRTYGLDLYDFEARQYDAIAPWFTSIDPLAEKYYSISPYAYCAGDPVNLVDRDGRCPLWLVTCSVGAVAGAVISGTIALAEGKSGKVFLAAAAGGAVAGAIAGTRAGLITGTMSTLSAAGIGAAFGGAGSGAGSCVEQGISKGFDNIDGGEVVGSVLGAGTGALGGKIAQSAEKVASTAKTNISETVSAKTNELVDLQKQGIKFSSNTGKSGNLTRSELQGIASSEVKKDIESTYKFQTETLSKIGMFDPVNPFIQKEVNENIK